MTAKTLQDVREEHSKLCATAHDRGVVVPENLAVDFETVLEGRAICTSLAKLLGLADGSEGEHSASPEPKKKARTPRASKGTAPKAANTAGERNMSTTTKKAKTTKKAPAKKAAKKTTAKKAKANGTAKKRGPSKTDAVVALMKRTKGVTREEVLELTGWKAVSMQQLAKSAGVKMTVSKERPFHYKAA